MSSNSVRLAAAQVTFAVLDRERCLAKAIAVIDEAAANGAQLVAFPETWIAGYPAWIFGAAAWDDPASKRAFAKLAANAIEIPSDATSALCEAARRNKIMVVMGVNERDTQFSNGTLYNSQIFISSKGELLGAHRKLIPTHAERIVWGQGDGSTLHVFDTEIGRVGGLICWEHWMPLSRFAMHAKGEQIHVAAWPELPDIHHLASRHYAFEGRCYVICVGSYLRASDLPEDFEMLEAMTAGGEFGEDPDELLPGGSGIIGPDGSWVVGPIAGREEIIYADVDLGRISEEQQALDVAGHYNRPDVFRVTVDERPRPQVAWLRDDPAEPVAAQLDAAAEPALG